MGESLTAKKKTAVVKAGEPKENLKFEDAMARLEKIVRDLETGELDLEDMLGRFEEGMVLARTCGDKLKKAESKIRILQKKTDSDGAPIEKEAGADYEMSLFEYTKDSSDGSY